MIIDMQIWYDWKTYENYPACLNRNKIRPYHRLRQVFMKQSFIYKAKLPGYIYAAILLFDHLKEAEAITQQKKMYLQINKFKVSQIGVRVLMEKNVIVP